MPMTRMVRAAALTNYFEVAHELHLNPRAVLAEAGLTRAMLEDPDRRIPANAAVSLLEKSARAAQCGQMHRLVSLDLPAATNLASTCVDGRQRVLRLCVSAPFTIICTVPSFG